MKLLLVSQHFWPETFGINRQVQDLLAQGVEVTVLTGKPNYPDGVIYKGYSASVPVTEFYSGVKIYRVPLIPRGRGSSIRLALNYFSFLFFAVILGPWILRCQKFDNVLVYATSPILQAVPALLIAWIKKIPLVVWVQDLWPQSLIATGHVRNKAILGAVSWVVGWIYRRSDLLLVQSRAFIATVQEQSGFCTPVRYFPNSAEWDSTADVRLGPRVEKWTERMRKNFSVVFTGNVGTAQSLRTIVDAAELCRDDDNLCFYVVGSGSESEWLSQEIRRRGLKNLIATGWLPSEAMYSIWGAASALLVTLRDEPIFHQTVPNKLQCYLAAGKPIIACLGGEGAQIVVDAAAGIACKPEDASAVAEATKALAAMLPTELLQLGDNGRRYFAEHFDPQVLTASLIEMLSQLIATHCDDHKR